jgi:hypothetical protein
MTWAWRSARFAGLVAASLRRVRDDARVEAVGEVACALFAGGVAVVSEVAVFGAPFGE